MSMRQFSGRFFFRDGIIRLKFGGPVSDDGQQTVIAMDEANKRIRIIRCDAEAYSFASLAEMVRDQFSQINEASTPSPQAAQSRPH